MSFQYPRCWIVSSDLQQQAWMQQYQGFQYPRCWIVSSDGGCGTPAGGRRTLSVSSLLDRFLRLMRIGHYMYPMIFQYPRCWIVSSDKSKKLKKTRPKPFQYPRCWIVSSDGNRASGTRALADFQYPRCWIVSSDGERNNSEKPVAPSFSILAVGSFPQTSS